MQRAGLTTGPLALRATWTSTAGPFRSRARSPGVWLEARLVAEVSYAELMQGRLRAPVFRGFVTRRALTVELAEVQRKLDRLVDALLADGSLPPFVRSFSCGSCF